MKNYLVVILICVTAGYAFSQQTYKESKFLTETYSYNQGDKIMISGERTFITIENSEDGQVEANVEVISRYNNQSQARADLEKMKLQFQKKGSVLYYSNALRIDDPKDKPKSNLKTILHLKVPTNANIEVANSYGGLSINGIMNYINVESRFCTTDANGFSGTLVVKSKYGTIECANSKATIEVSGNRSDLALNNISGDIVADLKYGNIDISFIEDTQKIDISTEDTPVTLIVSEKLSKNLSLQCKECDIDTDNCTNSISQDKNGSVHKVTVNDKSIDSQIRKIHSKKGDIKIITAATITNSK